MAEPTAAPTCVPRWSLACALAMALASGLAIAQSEDDPELAALLDLLAEETELATRSKQNADYVPGLVNVLHGEEARRLGARTVLDALARVPGLEVNRDQFGAATVRVRGIDFFFNSGNVKVLVDSLPISRETAFQNSGVLLMPIEQVERIEVIRGPGSGVHGDFAFMGLVNIVTRRDGNGITLGAGSGGRQSGVWHFEHGSDDGYRLAGNLSQWTSDRYDAPFRLGNDESRQFLNLEFAVAGLSLKAAALRRDFQGSARALAQPGQPPPPDGLITTTQDERQSVFEARYRWERDPEHRSALWLQLNNNRFTRRIEGFDGGREELGSETVWRFGRHLLLAQAQFARPRIDSAYSQTTRGFGEIEERRDYLALTLQDQLDIGEQLQLTGGLRYDDLQGVDSKLTPRIASLWRLGEHHLVKAQYAEGFRSPTYVELYAGGPPLSHTPFETVATSELAYIFRRGDVVFRASGYSSRIDDMIFPRGTPAFRSGKQVRSRGIELEFTQQLNQWLKVDASWSKANTSDDRSARIEAGQPPRFGGASLGQPEALGNLALLATLDPQWSLGLHWNHVGRRADQGQDGRLPGYDALNLNLEHQFRALPGLRLDLGLRNAFNEPLRHIASQPPNSVLQLDYGERLWSASLSWEY